MHKSAIASMKLNDVRICEIDYLTAKPTSFRCHHFVPSFSALCPRRAWIKLLRVEPRTNQGFNLHLHG